MVDTLNTQAFPTGGPKVTSPEPTAPGQGPGGAGKPGGGTPFADILKRVSADNADPKLAVPPILPERLHSVQEIDQVMPIIDRTFEAAEKASQTLGAAIAAYRKNA